MVAAWQAGLAVPVVIALVALLVVFAGLGRHVVTMTISAGPADGDPLPGSPPSPPPPATAPGLPLGSGPDAPVVIALAAAAVLGFLAVPLADVLTSAATALGGGS